jgi:hypothetical protein
MKETIEEPKSRSSLVKALSEFQSNCQPARKNKDQSFYKDKDGNASKYADINAIIEATKKPLTDAGLAFTVVPDFTIEKLKSVRTITHADGRVETVEKEEAKVFEFTRAILMCGDTWIEGKQTIKTGAKSPEDPQAVGGGMTFNRRYMQQCMLNTMLADKEDDDAEKLQDRPDKKDSPKRAVKAKVPAKAEGDLL